MVILGFDPGGVKNFGWCVAQAKKDAQLQVLDSGVENHAEGAIEAALAKARGFGKIEAAGIDSPLFWVPKGDRQADKTVRSAMRQLGAVYVGGTVQHVNALRGACLSQGIMSAYLLRRELPAIRITEAHPKVLLWLLHIANVESRVENVGMCHLGDFIQSDSNDLSDHERDAALGAVAAWAMINCLNGWRDLYPDEKNPFVPVSPVEYWMPLSNIAA